MYTSWGGGDDSDVLTATMVVNAVCRRCRYNWNRTAFCVALLRTRRIGYRKKIQPPPSTRNNIKRARHRLTSYTRCVCVCVCVYLLSYIVYEINWPRGGWDAHFENTTAALATYIIIIIVMIIIFFLRIFSRRHAQNRNSTRYLFRIG